MKSQNLTAVVIGASGLVGSQLVDQLLYDYRFTKVMVLARRSLKIDHIKLREHLIDFRKPENWQHLVQGDVLFSTLGTTLRTAGSKPAQYEVDFTFQLEVAKAAAGNGVKNYVLVSSIGANHRSSNFYLRMKGELEEAVKKLPYESISILRPGPLEGNRKEIRIAERISLPIINAINALGILKKYRPVHAARVAEKMVEMSVDGGRGIRVVENLEI